MLYLNFYLASIWMLPLRVFGLVIHNTNMIVNFFTQTKQNPGNGLVSY